MAREVAVRIGGGEEGREEAFAVGAEGGVEGDVWECFDVRQPLVLGRLGLWWGVLGGHGWIRSVARK